MITDSAKLAGLKARVSAELVRVKAMEEDGGYAEEAFIHSAQTIDDLADQMFELAEEIEQRDKE